MCLFPWSASLDPEGGKPKPDKEGELKLPCGKCTECIKLRAFEWGIRARHEISLHEDNCFLTLTYDDDHKHETLAGIKKPFQAFMKRLRKQSKKKLTYMVSHEFGSKTLRPHHHAIIFGYNPDNQELERYAPSGNPLYTSDDISKLWSKGFHSIGEANEKTAYYIASYALKGKKHTHFDDMGEEHTLIDTFDCSKRPAIGLNYFKNNMKQLVDSQSILPRYYQKKLEQFDEDLFEEYQNNKSNFVQNRGSQQRLAKFVISLHEKSSSSEYRSAPDYKLDYDYKQYLKSEVQLLREQK